MEISNYDHSIPAESLPRNLLAGRPAAAGASWRVRLVRRLGPASRKNHRLQAAAPALTDAVLGPEPSTTNSAGLLAGVARGDSRAMERCIEVHGPLVWGVVLRRVSDRSAAEDLTQEIFTEIWKHAGRHNPAIASEAGFVAMIARRRAIDWCRKQQRLPEMESLAASEDLPAATEGPGEGVDREVLWQALSPLPDETRRLFNLHFEQGMTHSEISEQTGLPLGSVKTRLRRGLIEARSLLQRLGVGANSKTTGGR